MFRFFKIVTLYLVALAISLEVIVRSLSFTDDVPMRKINKGGLQVFIENQKGISHGFPWKVNEDGFLGHNELNGKNQLLIIGDSYVENIMNPYSCRQSSLFTAAGYSVFEVGRSGITFIESLEFLKYYSSIVNPKKELIFLDNSDFEESIIEIKKLSDRGQISLVNKEIFKGEIKGKNIKKLLYNYKTMYYLYRKYLLSRKEKSPKTQTNKRVSHEIYVKRLVSFVSENYTLSNTLFVFRNKNDYKDVFIDLNLNFIELKISEEKYILKNDGHWNCDGHKEAFNRILTYLVE